MVVYPLEKNHKKDEFTSGNENLDNYLKKIASQDVKKKMANCFVLIDKNEDDSIVGYYTLSSTSIPKSDLDESLNKKVNKGYDYFPCALLGRLAVSVDYQGQGVGSYLLIDALKNVIDASSKLAVLGVVVDPIDDNAKKFYSKNGFIEFDSGRMFLSLGTIFKMVRSSEDVLVDSEQNDVEQDE